MYADGPYALSGGLGEQFLDPCIPRQNIAVQLQNVSGFALKVNSGATQVFIPPFTAVTLLLGGAYSLYVMPVTTGNVQAGSVLFTWLQPRETSPTPDGPLSTALASSVALTVSTPNPDTTFTITGGSALATEMTVIMAGGTGGSAFVTIKGATSATVYLNAQELVANQASAPYNFPVSGSLDTSFDVTSSTNAFYLNAATETT